MKAIRNTGVWFSELSPLLFVLFWTAIVFAFIYIGYRWIDPLPPRRLSIAAGAVGSTYDNYARQYAGILARNGVQLNVRNSAGAFRSGRNLAAWIGLVPKQHSTGGKERLGSITKQGNRYLRWLLVAGAMAVIRYARQHGTKRAWLTRIMDRRPAKVAAIALANKIARMAWAIMVRSDRYREPKLPLAA